MHVGDALSQIATIHAQMAKGEIYRGYRPIPVGCTAVLALVAAALSAWLPAAVAAGPFVLIWLGVAAVAGAVGLSETAFRYVFIDDAFGRRRTRQVVGQFVPCLAAGLLVTGVVAWRHPENQALLPGLWTILYAMGLFASRPYLPKAVTWVALGYLAAGAGLLALPLTLPLQGTVLGLSFSAGQATLAWVLARNQERTDHE